MDILQQSWFWTGVFAIAAALVGSLLTLIGIVVRERLARGTSIKVERLKLYEKARFDAHKTLYEFVASAYAHYWPPDDAEKDFESVMKELYYKHVKPGFPYYDQDLRVLLKTLENWYQTLHAAAGDAESAADRFNGPGYLNILNRLNEIVEKRFDSWLEQ